MTHQHEFTAKELYDGYHQADLGLANELLNRQRIVNEWKALLTKKAEAARGFILINKQSKREYKILYLWPDKDHAIKVAAVKPTKDDTSSLWMANLHEFEITNRRVKT